jgi:K+-transporting ATPase c subunit
VKHEYQLLDNTRYVLVHYNGDHESYVQVPMANSKSTGKTFVRTCPTVFNDIRKEAENGHKANEIYRKLISKTASGSDQGIKTPRNVEQVRNIVKKVNAQKKLSQDEMYNLIELAYHLNGTVLSVKCGRLP